MLYYLTIITVTEHIIITRMSDCCLMPNEQFSAISWSEQIIGHDVCLVLNRYAELDFYSASSLKKQSEGRHVASLGHIMLIPTNQNLLLLLWRSSKYQSYSLWIRFKSFPFRQKKKNFVHQSTWFRWTNRHWTSGVNVHNKNSNRYVPF